MIELGELEAHHAEFAQRNVRLVVASLEPPAQAQLTQQDFPHLVVVADEQGALIAAAEVLHPAAGPQGEDIAAPTTFLIDGYGMVRSLYRPRQVITRLSPQELLSAVDANLSPAP